MKTLGWIISKGVLYYDYDQNLESKIEIVNVIIVRQSFSNNQQMLIVKLKTTI